jgi:hypothetical protein
LIIHRIGKSMPRKTAAGAEAAAKWRAFRRYLDDIEGYEKVSESKQIFDKYLPYTVAFGIETSWVAKFASVDTSTPGWFEHAGDIFTSSPGRPYMGRSTTVTPRRDGGGVDLPDLDLPRVPNLQSASNRAGSGLQSASSGFSDLLNVAGAILSILSAFSGGGGRGGSAGGGGGGFR